MLHLPPVAVAAVSYAEIFRYNRCALLFITNARVSRMHCLASFRGRAGAHEQCRREPRSFCGIHATGVGRKHGRPEVGEREHAQRSLRPTSSRAEQCKSQQSEAKSKRNESNQSGAKQNRQTEKKTRKSQLSSGGVFVAAAVDVVLQPRCDSVRTIAPPIAT